jgi:hypothetical protein
MLSMELDDLITQNPWWRDPQAIQNDPKVRDFDNAKIPWTPRLKTDINMDKDRIYTLRGPRQVGKTTLVKLIIREILFDAMPIHGKVSPIAPSSTNPPRSVFYFSCDMLRNEKELEQVIKMYLDFSERPKPSKRKYIFIDETSSVKNWEKVIKYLADADKLKNTAIILTGSHSLEIKNSIERLPGRRGEKSGDELLDKILVPMKFSEYVETVNPELKENLRELLYCPKDKRFSCIFNLFKGKLDPNILDEYKLYQKDIKALLDNYLVTGGIIRSVEEFYTNDAISSTTYEIYIKSIIGDMARWNYHENITKQVLRSVIDKMTTNISMNSIAEENEIGSHNTVSSYLCALEDSYVLSNFYQYELHKDVPSYRKNRKIYFIDPFIYHAVNGWVHGNSDYFDHSKHIVQDSEMKSNLLEMVVAGHMIRLAYNLKMSDVFSHHDCLFYWRKKGTEREVDFVLKHDKNVYPIEVKYQNKVTRRDLSNLFTFQKGILASKNTVDTYKQYSTIPVDLLLMLI